MAGPIAHIGTPGTSRYSVDFSPIERGLANLGTGFGGLVKSIRDDGRKKAEQMSLAEMMSFVGDGQKFLSEGVKRGIPIGTLHKMATAHSSLAPKKGDPFTLGQNDVRFDAQGNELARGPAGAPKDDRTTFQRQYEYAKSQGFPGTPADWRKAGAARTTINNRMTEGQGKAAETAERVAFGMERSRLPGR